MGSEDNLDLGPRIMEPEAPSTRLKNAPITDYNWPDINNAGYLPTYESFPVFNTSRGGISYERPLTWEPKPSKHDRFLTLAMGVALTSKCRFKHGAIVVRHSKILGASPNVYKNNPRHSPIESCSVHAEIRAMQKAGWPNKVSLYVARVNNQGESRLSQPCANCQTVLDGYKVKVYWTES